MMDPALATIVVAACSTATGVVVALVRMASALAVSTRTASAEHQDAYRVLGTINGKLDDLDHRISAHIEWHLTNSSRQ